MNKSNSREQSMRLTRKVSSERMLAAVAMTSMYMLIQVLVLTFVERNLLLLRASRVSPADPD